MHLFINCLAASAGGGLTYLRNIIPHLAARNDVRATVALAPGLAEGLFSSKNIDFLELEIPPARRYWFEQTRLPALIRDCGADLLLSTGNFALRKSPVPQILLSRNSIYTSKDFYGDLRSRRQYRLWLDTWFRGFLAKRSIDWADVTVAPSEAFAADLRRWTGRHVIAVHHGFDWESFTRNSSDLAPDVQSKLMASKGCLKLLFVSHYNYYRNFETLIRALPMLRDQMGAGKVKLLLTCQLRRGVNPGSYNPELAARLIRQLGVLEMVVELGTIPYPQLHQVYSEADIYVSPAYTETFAHPLVEAMASGVPVSAADIAVHREICTDSAMYFERFSPSALASCIVTIAQSNERRGEMISSGKARARDFSWSAHLERIIGLSRELIRSKPSSVASGP